MAFQDKSHKLSLCLKNPERQRVWLVVAPYLGQQLKLDISYVWILGSDLEPRESLTREPHVLTVRLTNARSHLNLSARTLILQRSCGAVGGRWTSRRPLEKTTAEVLFVFVLLMRLEYPEHKVETLTFVLLLFEYQAFACKFVSLHPEWRNTADSYFIDINGAKWCSRSAPLILCIACIRVMIMMSTVMCRRPN